jgi:hypothetical protein
MANARSTTFTLADHYRIPSRLTPIYLQVNFVVIVNNRGSLSCEIAAAARNCINIAFSVVTAIAHRNLSSYHIR